MKIVLASTSEYRKSLLNKVLSDFTCVAPGVDETPEKSETPDQLAVRLAHEKALAVANQLDSDESLVIGSDQVAELNGFKLGKPGSVQRAIEQLTLCSGQQVNFHTGLCVINSKTKQTETAVEIFSVKFRTLSSRQIRNYVEKDLPLHCAGSFKSEGLGITLFEKLEGNDPNTLVGLPLIKLIDLLSIHGYELLDTL